MPLNLESRRVGDIVVIRCAGRLIAGAECEQLQKHVADALSFDRNFVVNLGDVPFIDSSGIGTLVRLLGRARAAHGNLKLCGVVPHVADVFKVTYLDRVFESHESESDAITDFYRQRPAASAGKRGARVLCIHTSADVLAYMREVLLAAGYDPLTASNLLDGKVLLAATRPSLVVISSQLRKLKGTLAADSFHDLSKSVPVVELNDAFTTDDPGEAANALRSMVSAAIGMREAAAEN